MYARKGLVLPRSSHSGELALAGARRLRPCVPRLQEHQPESLSRMLPSEFFVVSAALTSCFSILMHSAHCMHPSYFPVHSLCVFNACSVSVNIYRESPAKYVIEQLLRVRPHWPTHIPHITDEALLTIRAGLTRDYITTVVEHVLVARAQQLGSSGAVMNATQFVKRIVSSRLSHPFTDPLLSWNTLLWKDMVSPALCIPGSIVEPLAGPVSIEAATTVSALLLEIPVHDVLPSILADYVERVAADGVGTKFVLAFFSQCYS